jgi:hypothetical protein
MTTAPSRSQLTDLQKRFLHAFAALTDRFFLTGGAVLAGWILGHRRTDDLDLFTTDDGAMADADRLVRAVAAGIDATVEAVHSSVDFKRYVIRAGTEAIMVDLVRDRAPQLYRKIVRDGLRTDSPEEIVANKICAFVERSEVRDLIDLYFLEQAGYGIESFLDAAATKDGGVTPAVFAWLLNSLHIPDTLAAGVSAEALRGFAKELEKRMRRLALPK